MRPFAVSIVVALVSVSLFAADAAPKTSEDELDDLLKVISEETDLATRTRMNRDYVPGMMTVLDGDTLEALGCRTVLDALSLVPGMQAFREISGAPNISVRGIAFPFNAGNTRVLIDSVALSREDAGLNSAALLTPIEQVDRIEIVRGPSSSLHGAFAFAGVINVVTRSHGRRVFAGVREGGRVAGGYVAAPIGNWQMSLSSAPYRGDRNEGPAGTDAHAHGSTNILALSHEGFSLKAQHLRRDEDFIGQRSYERSTGLEARQHFTLSSTLGSETRINVVKDEFASTDVGKQFKGDVLEGATALQWKPSPRHDLLADLSFTRSHIEYAHLRLPSDPALPALLSTNVNGITRDSEALALQDQIEVNPRLTVTLGVRGDHYEDVGDRVTPRAGAVFRATDHHIFKVQYAEGFRPPTFWELYAPGYANPDLTFETMRTLEAGYVYHQPDAAVRLTAFRSNIGDMLYLVLPPQGPGPTIFENNTSARMHGIEAEVERQENERFRWLANTSWVHTWDGRSTSAPDGQSAVAADWLANAAALYRPIDSTVLSLRLLHVGRRHTLTGTVSGYDSLDFTASFVANPEWTFRAGVHNLLDDDITYLLAFPNQTLQVGFGQRRSAWVAVSRKL